MDSNPFLIDRDAPKVEAEGIRPLIWQERKILFQDAVAICGHWSDDDKEVLYLSRGGQVLRETRAECYVCDPEYAYELLADFADDETLELLMQAGAFSGARIPDRTDRNNNHSAQGDLFV
ncbi:hypothetical protein IB279_34355 [Ensifer sp. ENS06]|uniref:hypothetical protein n=1 Tax=Ensifer sp. ENS06 TaxID=2769276 RepID=UPI00177AACE3|nr:hypothetical protein [Ensifer sp. ENS06]MBD9628036.1 hypothetical protein [Ensifer sp. ENS06]